MKITIYRYPHPFEDDKWLYTGQTTNLKNRDVEHRKMRDGFGRLFKSTFPGVPLTLPDSHELEVESHLGANWEETVAIFRNHTWHAEGGMNRTLPGSQDYLNLAKIGGKVTASLPGHLSKVGKIGGSIAAKKHKENGTGIFGLTTEQRIANGSKLGKLQVKNKKGIFKPGFDKTLGPSIAGRKNAEKLGYLRRIGIMSGKKKVESGEWDRIRLLPQTKEAQSKSGIKNCHKRWHVKRGLVSPTCSLCIFVKE